MSSCHRSERVPTRDDGGGERGGAAPYRQCGPALLSCVDVEARYVWCNESYRRAFGCTSEQIRGKHIREVLGVAGWESVRPHLTRALSGEPVSFDNQVRLENGARAALVAVTGYGQDDDLRRSSAAGFDRHLVKPIDGAALRKLLAEMSDRFGPGTA